MTGRIESSTSCSSLSKDDAQVVLRNSGRQSIRPKGTLGNCGDTGSGGGSHGSTDAISTEALSDNDMPDCDLSETDTDDEWEGLETTAVW